MLQGTHRTQYGGCVLPVPPVRTSIKQVEAAARQALSAQAQAAAWAAGQTMTMEQVIAEASDAAGEGEVYDAGSCGTGRSGPVHFFTRYVYGLYDGSRETLVAMEHSNEQ